MEEPLSSTGQYLKMSATESQTRAEDDGSHCPVGDEIIQCHPSDHIAPDTVAFSPDDKLISYNVTSESTLETRIFAFDLALKEQRLLLTLPDEEVEKSVEDNLSPDETKRRKRLGERGLGFTRYAWAKGASGPTLMVPLPGGIYVQDESTAELQLRVPSTVLSPVFDFKLSPDGCSIAYVRDDEIYVIPTTNGEEIQITSGATGTGKTNGMAEGIVLVFILTLLPQMYVVHPQGIEIKGETERRPGFWWSGDSSQIAFLEVDATGVPPSPAVDQGKNWDDGDANVVEPSVGKANVFVRLGIVPASGGEVSWVQLLIGGTEHDDEEHLAKVMWLPDGFLVAEVQNQDKTKTKLLKFNPSTGKRQILLEEKGLSAKHSDCYTPLQTGGFIWASERSGFRHLYLYDAAGECLGPLTEGTWAVEKVLGVGENAGIVYFMGTSTNPLETHLFSTLIFPDYKFPIGNPKQLTREEGQHIVVIDHQKQKFVDILMDSPPRVHVRSLASSRLTVLLGLRSPNKSADLSPPTPEQLSELVVSSEEELEKDAAEELKRAAAVLLKHGSTVFEGLCGQCVPLLQKSLDRLARFDTPSELLDRTGEHFEAEDETPSLATVVTKTLLRDLPHPGTVNGNGVADDAVNHSETGDETPSIDTAAETPVSDLSHDGTENGNGTVDDTVSSGETTVSESHPGTVGRQQKPRLWSEEQSSGSELDEELSPPFEDHQASQAAGPKAADIRVQQTAPVESQCTPDNGRQLSFARHSAIESFAWSNTSIPSPRQIRDEEILASSTPEPAPEQHNGTRGEDIESQSPVAKKSRLQLEARRMQYIERKKDFETWERIKGRLVNVAEGLELHKKVFNNVEQQKLIDMVYKYQEMGRNGLLRDRTYSEPRKWMPGKGRVTIQFGCCYNYAVDRNGNPPGIMHDELVDPLPNLLKTTIRRLVRWGVLPEDCVPDSCIINIYDVGDCIPPHIDHHDFVRPFSTLSLLSECNILFGSRLSIVGDGKFDGPLSVPLPVGSVLVLKGNGADVAKHAVPGVPTGRISITFRKMDPLRVPRGYELPQDLKGIRTAPHLR